MKNHRRTSRRWHRRVCPISAGPHPRDSARAPCSRSSRESVAGDSPRRTPLLMCCCNPEMRDRGHCQCEVRSCEATACASALSSLAALRCPLPRPSGQVARRREPVHAPVPRFSGIRNTPRALVWSRSCVSPKWAGREISVRLKLHQEPEQSGGNRRGVARCLVCASRRCGPGFEKTTGQTRLQLGDPRPDVWDRGFRAFKGEALGHEPVCGISPCPLCSMN